MLTVRPFEVKGLKKDFVDLAGKSLFAVISGQSRKTSQANNVYYQHHN